MTETPTRRGRPRGVESQHVMVRMSVDLIAQIDAYAASLQEQIGLIDINISRGMAIRDLVKRGLQSVQANPMAQASRPPIPQAPPPQASQPPSHLATVDEPEPAPQPTVQPAIPLALEPAPKTAHPVPVPQASETPITASAPPVEQTPSSQTPAPQPERHELAIKTALELSEDIVRIAEARALYDRLSERAFIQLLFDQGIYRHRSKDGREVPLPHSTYRDWMQRARAAGIL